MYFKVTSTQGNSAKFSWWLFGENHRQAGWAGETWDSKSKTQSEAESFRLRASRLTYDVFADTAGEWRWRALNGTEKVAASGESFDSKSNAQRAADNVRDNAGRATGL